MLRAVFTLDYEIHGNGEGSPYALMVEPTRRMLDQFDQYGAKLTILADIGEILQFKRYAEETGRDDYHYAAIASQLQDAIRRGHDVQLHIHSSYFNARHEQGRWIQDWSEYNFAGLDEERASAMIGQGKAFLEQLLRPVNANYRCHVFRAANWAMSPSRNATRALARHGFTIETSVFKYGRRQGIVSFDYSHAPDPLLPWRAHEDDVCRTDPAGALVEFPIYCEQRWLGAFVSPNRIYRACVGRMHRISPGYGQEGGHTGAGGGLAPARKPSRRRSLLADRHAWKADFNQCGGWQLIRALQRAERLHPNANTDLPFVLIGHSKIFTRFNEWSLQSFLRYIANRPARFGFARFGDFDTERLARQGTNR